MKVKLIDITENPVEKIYKCYRICYSKDCFEEIKVPVLDTGEKDMNKMRDFILPLMEEFHTSPLEHVSFSFSIGGLSRAALAQLTRHRTFKFNVQSQRYVNGSNFNFVMPDLAYMEDKEAKEAADRLVDHIFKCSKLEYENLVSMGVKKEDARAILPQATTCNLVVTMDLNNFRNFLRQRLCSHAQKEIRQLAREMNKQVKKHIPFSDHKVLLCQQGICDLCSNSNK